MPLFVQTEGDGRLARAYVTDVAVPDCIEVDAGAVDPAVIVGQHRDWRLVAGVLTHDPLPIADGFAEQISSRQFFQQLAIGGDITQDEALAMITAKTLPADLSGAIGQMPAADQFNIKMLVLGALTFSRHHPATEVLRNLLGKTPAETDAIWVAAAAL